MADFCQVPPTTRPVELRDRLNSGKEKKVVEGGGDRKEDEVTKIKCFRCQGKGNQ
jgi:hypothetical protein